jgi:hypothetical protein
MLQPESTLREVFDYLEIDSSSGLVADILARAADTRPRAQEEHRTAPSFKESVGRWRHDLSPRRQTLCAEAFDDILIRFGYEPTDVTVASEIGAE